MSKLETYRSQELECLIKKGVGEGPTVVMIHGYGAEASDLIPLMQMFSREQNMTWIFPQGLHEVPIGPHMMGRAWFMIDFDALQSGDVGYLAQSQPKGLVASKKALKSLLVELNVKTEDIVYAGFSQGAMLALEMALDCEQLPLGLVLFSSSPLAVNSIKKRSIHKKGLNFLQSHGHSDPILAFEQAKNLFNLLEEQGLKGEFVAFKGGHEIPQAVLQKFAVYINEALFRRRSLY